MMKSIVALAITMLLFINAADAHGGHMATFVLDRNSNGFVLEFKIDNHVLNHLPMEQSCENYSIAKALCISQYINEHMQLLVDGEKVAFELDSSEQEEHFFILKMTSNLRFSDSSKLTIKNNCFYEYDSQFENRLVFKSFGTFVNSYRFSQKQTSVLIN